MKHNASWQIQSAMLMDHVSATGEPVVITKRATPVAKVVPSLKETGSSRFDGVLCSRTRLIWIAPTIRRIRRCKVQRKDTSQKVNGNVPLLVSENRPSTSSGFARSTAAIGRNSR